MDFGLDNVHVLITGASGDIGLVTARLFLKIGARVTAHYNTKSAPLDPLVQEFGAERIRALQADLRQEGAVEQLFASATADPFGPVQVLIVNHAYHERPAVPVVEMSLSQWESAFSINVTSAFLVVREYLRGLEKASDVQKTKAAITLIGSTAGKFGEAGHADYAAAKSAMMYGLCLSLKNEIVKIAPKGRVNVVAPGWVKTPKKKEAQSDPDIFCKAVATIPLKKFALPEDVANQIVVLSSSTVSGHVSGHVLMVAGGMEGRLLNTREDLGL